ncbi:hypothetical protein FEP76_06089 [Burkholderia multivorans]|nr:hypothetical protein [Burkholderia multivorans]
MLVERLRGSRGLFDERRVLLRDLVHLGDSARDLVDATALLLGRRRDLAHDVGHALHRTDHVAHRASRFVDERRARADPLDRRVDQRLDLLGRARRTLRETAHLARDDREPAPFLARACGFDGRVQREDVGLECNALDDRDDVRDLGRARIDLAHRVDDLPDHRITLVCNFRRIRGQRACLARIVRVLFHGAGQLLHARRRFLQRRGLFFGPRRQVDVAGRDLPGRRRDRLATAAHRAHRVDEPALHLREAVEQLAHFVASTHDDRAAQIARGNRVEMRERIRERTADRAAQCDPRQQRGDEADREHDDRHDTQRVIHRFRVIEPRLSVAELEVAQRFVRAGEFVEAHLQLLRAVADPIVVAGRDGARERVATGLQRLPLRCDVLREPVLFRPARQREILLPPRVGLCAHGAAALDGGRRVGCAGQQCRAIEREPLAGREHFGHRHVDRARHLVREDLARRLVRARHPVQAEHADYAQQRGEKSHRQTDTRTYRQVPEDHRRSCVASPRRAVARYAEHCFGYRIYDGALDNLMVFALIFRLIRLFITDC